MSIRWASISSGLKGEADTIVESNTNTARHHKSGNLDVFATPAMIALMEEAACAALKSSLSEGETTVRCIVGVYSLIW
jgi:fluoroacetyl-CoA thioesterase